MAIQFQKRDWYKNLEVLQRLREGRGLSWFYRISFQYLFRDQPPRNNWLEQDRIRQEDLARIKRRLEKSVHKGICRYSRDYFHPIWRNAGKKICRLYLIGEDTRAENLDPQPERLGIMWHID